MGFAGQLHQTDKVGERKKRIVRVKIERYVLLCVRLFFFCTVRAPFTINERLVDFFSFFFSSKHFLPSRCVKSEWRSNLLWKFKKKKKKVLTQNREAPPAWQVAFAVLFAIHVPEPIQRGEKRHSLANTKDGGGCLPKHLDEPLKTRPAAPAVRAAIKLI